MLTSNTSTQIPNLQNAIHKKEDIHIKWALKSLIVSDKIHCLERTMAERTKYTNIKYKNPANILINDRIRETAR